MLQEIEDELPDELCEGQYVFNKLLYQPETGPVCSYTKRSTGEEFMVKFDPPPPVEPNLIGECLFLKNKAEGLSRIPKYVFHETINNRRFLIMQMTKYSLEEYIQL